MGLGSRLAAMLGHGRSDGESDPQADLDASYDRQAGLLQQTRRGAADVATSRKRLELQLRQLESAADGLHQQAQAAVDSGDDGRARVLLTQRAALLEQVDQLGPQERALREQEEQLGVSVLRLEAKVDAFRSQKDALAAGYTAAEAQSRIGQALAGVDEELGDVGFALQRARDRTEAMQARAGALAELGELSQASLSPGDAAERRLAELTGGGVEDELAALQGRRPLPGPLELSPGAAPDSAPSTTPADRLPGSPQGRV